MRLSSDCALRDVRKVVLRCARRERGVAFLYAGSRRRRRRGIKESLKGPVGANAAWGVLLVDGGVHVAAVEKRETPIEGCGVGVGSGKAIGYRDAEVIGQCVGIANRESECAAGAIGALVGSRKRLRRGWAVPESQIFAGGNSRGGGVQEIDSVRTGVQEAGVGGVVESGGDLSGGRIDGIDGRVA